MKSEFDMVLFLSPVLKGAHATRQRHIRQAENMQRAIRQRWKCPSPWAWKEKHVRWYFDGPLGQFAPTTRYYYSLTAALIRLRRGCR
ncbi:hypothetical protein [Pseudomonas sp.]|uniref:hypothetical protein n=1 Tax=Pseudomonas sp. TaxID=306 RepID=UPI00261CF9CB|nr:hypothetical protein [Pseudomonas sp.]